MTQEELENGQFVANWVQLSSDNAHFIVPAANYNVKLDERLLIPYIQNQKIGFVNNCAVPVVPPKYDIFNGDIFNENDFVKVGIKYSYGFNRATTDPWTSIGYKLGLIDYTGKTIFEPIYSSISISDDKQLFTLHQKDKGYCVVDRNGNEIVPFGRFELIDGYTNGYARVKKHNKWGIIDADGNVALTAEYDNIWKFYEKTELKYTKVIKDGVEKRFYFATGAIKEQHVRYSLFRNNNDYGSHYGEFAGTYAQEVAGFSDEAINDAFDGEPDAYWNID